MGFPFLIRKGRFLPILFASTRAKPLDAACNPLGPPRRGNSGWDSPFSSRPIRNAGVSLSREAEALGCRGQSSQTKSRAADDGTERSRGNGQRESRLGFLFFFRKKPLSSNFIRSGKGEAFGCRVQSTRPAAQRKFRLGFPVFFLSYAKRWRVAFEGGCSPWMPRAILPAEIPCCRRQHGTKQRQRAEGIPVGIPLFLIRKGRFLPILSAATRAKPLDAARSPPGPPRRGNSGWDSPFSSYPMRNGGVSLSRGAVAPGCRVQSSQTKSRAADGGTKRSRGGRMRDCFPVFTPRRGFPRFLLILFETVACRFRGGCSPWIPRAILLAEIPCCLRRHGTKQRQRAEGIPVSF